MRIANFGGNETTLVPAATQRLPRPHPSESRFDFVISNTCQLVRAISAMGWEMDGGRWVGGRWVEEEEDFVIEVINRTVK